MQEATPGLLDSLRRREPDALSTVFEMYADRIYRLAQGVLQDPDQAEDILQDTFVKVITHIDRFEGRSNLGTWLYRVTYNASLDRLRNRPEYSLVEDEPETDGYDRVMLPAVLVEWHTPEQQLIAEENRQFLDESIRNLPEALHSVFLLRDIEELSTAEVAEILGISQNLVKVRLHRARLLLRESLANYFMERQPNRG